MSTRLRRGQPANRAVAEQIREARRIAEEAARMAEREREFVEEKDLARTGYRQLYDMQEFAEKLDWVNGLEGDSSHALLKSYQEHKKLGAYRRVATAPDPAVLDLLARDFPNFTEVTQLICRRLHLCRIAPEKLLRLPPILLDGPPGIGKTAYCKRLAELLGMRFEQIDLSSGGVDFTMTGLDSGYSSGRPGRIWDSLKQECMSVLWLLDEIDKPGESKRHSGINYLLGLLEPVSARRFIDNAALLPLDTSWIFYIATCNNRTLIDPPILTRFEVLDIAAPTKTQMLAVVSSISSDMRNTEDWAVAFDTQLTDSIVLALSTSAPREIRRRLIQGYANAAAHQRRKLILDDIPPRQGQTPEEARRIGFI